MKRLLAYHSVENIGIILIGLGFAMIAAAHGHPAWGQLALAGRLLHVWNHGLFKALLFLGAGSVLHATGTREMSRLGGLWRAMPWTAGLFALGAMAIAGLPPLNGFVSEWLVYLGLFDAVSGATARPALGRDAGRGGFARADRRAGAGVFCESLRRGFSRPAAQRGGGARARMRLADARADARARRGVRGHRPGARFILAGAGQRRPPPGSRRGRTPLPPAPLVTLGAFHLALAALATLAAVLLWRRVKHNGVARAGTWDCGYAAPTPRMQYTAGSFAGIITGWFAWILRPQRHAHLPRDIFPRTPSYEEHTPETVLEQVVEPAGSRRDADFRWRCGGCNMAGCRPIFFIC